MTTTRISTLPSAPERWLPDYGNSAVEFEVGHLWGLGTVRGRFTRFAGSCRVGSDGATIELSIDAASVDTGNSMRDRHLRSEDFFDVGEHPHIRFTSTRAVQLEPGQWHVSGELEAAGTVVPIAFDASAQRLGDKAEVEMSTTVDQSAFGMQQGPLRNVRPPTRLHVYMRLFRAGGVD